MRVVSAFHSAEPRARDADTRRHRLLAEPRVDPSMPEFVDDLSQLPGGTLGCGKNRVVASRHEDHHRQRTFSRPYVEKADVVPASSGRRRRGPGWCAGPVSAGSGPVSTTVARLTNEPTTSAPGSPASARSREIWAASAAKCPHRWTNRPPGQPPVRWSAHRRGHREIRGTRAAARSLECPPAWTPGGSAGPGQPPVRWSVHRRGRRAYLWDSELITPRQADPAG